MDLLGQVQKGGPNEAAMTNNQRNKVAVLSM